MTDDVILEKLRNAFRQRLAQDPQERFQDLVRRGVIDEQGNVLVRMPEPEKKSNPPKKKSKTKS